MQGGLSPCHPGVLRRQFWGEGHGRVLALYPVHTINDRITDLWSPLPEVVTLGWVWRQLGWEIPG